MKKLIFTVSFLLSAGAFKAQGLYNNGANIVVSSGTYLVLDGTSGNFRNETSGNDGVIDLTGTLKLGGNFTNNVSSSDAFGTLASGSEVIFAGTSTQTIGGSSTAVYNFDKITVNSGATVEVTAGKKGNRSRSYCKCWNIDFIVYISRWNSNVVGQWNNFWSWNF